jgi:hypothetical protein
VKELLVEGRLAEVMIQSGPQNADNSSTYSVLGEGRWACECECDGTSGPSAAAISACAPGAPVRDATTQRIVLVQCTPSGCWAVRVLGAVNRARAPRSRVSGCRWWLPSAWHRSAPRGVTRLLIGSEWSGGWFGDNPIPTRPTTLGLAH